VFFTPKKQILSAKVVKTCHEKAEVLYTLDNYLPKNIFLKNTPLISYHQYIKSVAWRQEDMLFVYNRVCLLMRWVNANIRLNVACPWSLGVSFLC
jgi:hypothetical protein